MRQIAARRIAALPDRAMFAPPGATLNPFTRQIVVIKQLFAAMLGRRAEIA